MAIVHERFDTLSYVALISARFYSHEAFPVYDNCLLTSEKKIGSLCLYMLC